MAKRDYKAEEARRNALARARGFTTRAQQRYKIETGKIPAIRPALVRSPRTLIAQERYKRAAAQPKRTKTGLIEGRLSKSERAELPLFAGVTYEQAARDWSEVHSRVPESRYAPELAHALGVTKEHYRAAYLRAFVIRPADDDEAGWNARIASPLKYWIVTLNGFTTDDLYDRKY